MARMRIYGLDFTSAPSRKKPLQAVGCSFDGDFLRPESLEEKMIGFSTFEEFLRKPGPWVCGMDFPFGQPKRWVRDLGWPASWEGYVKTVAKMSKEDFEAIVREYSRTQSEGNKLPKRLVDRRAGAQPPMKLDFIPVGKMFFQGAPRLLKADVSVRPCRPTDNAKTVIESYPALVARRFLGERSYKSDTRKKQTDVQRAAREKLVTGLRSATLEKSYGFVVEMNSSWQEKLIREPAADTLDSLLCAVQAAWAYTKRDEGWGVPEDCDRDEGCMLDPQLLAGDG
ncbi:MAG: DUF429 domain-containing protein [Rubrobacter sp.]|nr:DUF429 domain-containing protein [Rubrobacter sp.]